MSEAINGFMTTVAGVIILTFSAVTATILAWYFLKKDASEQTKTPPQSSTAQPALVQRIAEKSVTLLNILNETVEQLEKWERYAIQKVEEKKRTAKTRDEQPRGP